MVRSLIFAMPNVVKSFDRITKIPNLAIASIAGNVDTSICDIKVADLLLVKNKLNEYVTSLLGEYSPDIVGLSCMSFQYHEAVNLAKLIKNYNKDTLVALGGYHPTLMFEEISKSPESEFIDFIVRGEGEATFNELVNALNSGRGYEKIDGLSFKRNGTFQHNPRRKLLDLNTINLPNRKARLLTKGFHAFGLPSDVIETSRGCTFNCKFCSISHMYGQSFRKYEISRVIEDIRNINATGVKSIIITDDNITLDLGRLEELCDEIISAKLNSIHYVVQASVKGISHSSKLVQKMADAGIKIVFIGIESVFDETLDFLRKKSTTSEDTRKAVQYLRDNGIICIGGVIIGNPDDDEKSLWKTFDIVSELKVDIPVFSILTPHAKTQIRKELIELGLVTNLDDFSTYNGFYSNIKTKYLTADQVHKTMIKMYDAYFNRLSYLRFNRVARIYPIYFLKLVAKEIIFAIPRLVQKLTKRGEFKTIN